MASFFKKHVYSWKHYLDHIIFASCVALSLGAMQLGQSVHVEGFRVWLNDRRATLQTPFSYLVMYSNLKKENEWLRKQTADYIQSDQLYREVENENRRLRAFLGFAERVDFGFIPAEVTGRHWQSNQGIVYINAGWKQGCQKDMALVTHEGIIGKIVTVGQSGATGMLLNHPAFRISARVQRTRQVGIVRWLYGNRCVLEGVPYRSDVQIGDRIVASGYGHIYPPGYLIGHVVSVEDDAKGMFKIVELKTAVDLGQLELLFVVQRDGVSALEKEDLP